MSAARFKWIPLVVELRVRVGGRGGNLLRVGAGGGGQG